MKLEFYGAAGEVTGSCHVLHVGSRKVLLDCGLIQGSRRDEARNREPFPFEAGDIDAVVLSHAHLDHSGRLPLLVKRGFKGPIYTHNATRDLCRVLLLDAADLNERDTESENRRRLRKGLPTIEPLYGRDEVENTLRKLVGLGYREKTEILPGIGVCFYDAGHIMGSSISVVTLEQGSLRRTLVFSGDLGQYDSPILHDPTALDHADVVLMESTYGGRLHRDRESTLREIGTIIKDAAHDRGNILIPAFAIGRSQEVLYTLGKNYEQWGLKNWRVFLDSPMAIDVSKIYWDYPHLYDEEATTFRRNVNEMPPLKNLHLTRSVAESRVINRLKTGAIIIAGSGMCNGGRIVHHLKHNVWRPECHVVIVGYQAAGSLGRQLVDGRARVRIHGETVQVGAQIHTVGGLSAHGDQEDLFRWYAGFKNRPPLFLVHGESASALALAKKIRAMASAPSVGVAAAGESIDLAAF